MTTMKLLIAATCTVPLLAFSLPATAASAHKATTSGTGTSSNSTDPAMAPADGTDAAAMRMKKSMMKKKHHMKKAM